MSWIVVSLASASAAVNQTKSDKGPLTLDVLLLSWLKRADLKHSLVGVEVMELPSGKVLFGFNGNRRFVPASSAKVFSSACAFDKLGGAYTYSTKVGVAGTIDGDTLKGDVVIEPSQDPTLTSGDLRELVNSVKSYKISHVTGKVRTASWLGQENFLPGWLGEDWGQEWMPVPSNLVLDRNIWQGQIPQLKVTGDASEAQSAHTQTLLSANLSAGWLTYLPGAHRATVALSPKMSIKNPLVITNPDEFNLAVAAHYLNDSGVVLDEQTTGLSTESVVNISEHKSKPLSEIIKICLHESDNLYAQQLLRTVGLPGESPQARKGKTSNLTLEERGLNHLVTWLGSIGVPTNEAVLFDGCGLSRKNCVSPHALNMVLRHMAGPNLDGPYLALLKSSEHGGKSRYRFKTGAMDSVRSVSGVLTTQGGQTLAVTIMINGHTPSIRGLRASIGDLVNLLSTITSLKEKQAQASVEVINEVTANAITSGNMEVQRATMISKPKPHRTMRNARRSRSRR